MVLSRRYQLLNHSYRVKVLMQVSETVYFIYLLCFFDLSCAKFEGQVSNCFNLLWLLFQYSGGRSEQDFIDFLNEKCKTKRKSGGGISDDVIYCLYLVALRYYNHLSKILIQQFLRNCNLFSKLFRNQGLKQRIMLKLYLR